MLIDPRTVRRTVISGANPVTKLAASLVLSAALLATVDVVSAGLALVMVVALLPMVGVAPRVLARVFAPILLTSLTAGVVTVLIGQDSGQQLATAGPLTITEGSLRLGVAISLRVLALSIPAVALLISTDATDLGDALSQRLHLPARFVLGAVAALRLVGALVSQWQTLSMARRARGLGDSVGVMGRVRVLTGQSFSLLVLALRRGTRLAMAMEGRGFGAPGPRTWARPSVFGRRDIVVLAGAVVIAAASTWAALAAGTWSFIL